MEQTFQFKIGLGYAPDIMLIVEIPMGLHDRICQYITFKKHPAVVSSAGCSSWLEMGWGVVNSTGRCSQAASASTGRRASARWP